MMDSSQQSQHLQELKESVQTALVDTVRGVNRLANEDLQFQRTANPSVARRLDEQSDRVFQTINDLLKSAAIFTDQRAPAVEDVDDTDIQWKDIVDVIDGVLEKVDTALDDYNGLLKRKQAPAPEPDRETKRPRSTTAVLDWSLKRANILKPQDAFENKPNNLSVGPWKPILTEKPHAKVSLEESLAMVVDEETGTQYAPPAPQKSKKSKKKKPLGLSIVVQPGPSQVMPPAQPSTGNGKKTKNTANWRERMDVKLLERRRRLTNGFRTYRHPYEAEIVDLEYPAQVYERNEPQKYLPIETTKATWVDTYEGVLEMLEELKKATEIAIDLEHHDYRSYAGILSLMQISTREKDWLVDTLVPWRHKLEVLNEVLADPKIVKVLHGAFMDILWLQRDLGLYVVGLFDTFCAADNLGYPSKSLAALLKKFVDFDADKKYQLADWRIRPLPEEMFYYAQCDTHFLLYIYDEMRNELLDASDRDDPDKNFIEAVLQASKEVSLKRYEVPWYDLDKGIGARGWLGTLLRTSAMYNGEQFAVFKAVHKWRDDLARLKDESTLFIMSQQVHADIAQIMPTDKKALWSLLGNHNAKHLKSHVDELFDIIQAARASGINGPSLNEFLCKDSPSNGWHGSDGRHGKSAEQDTSIPDISELRSQRSQLWGDMPMSSIWDKPNKATEVDKTEKIFYAYPRPMHNEAGDAVIPMPAEKTAKLQATDRHDAPEPDAVIDQEFTLKAGRKRKFDGNDEEVAGRKSNPRQKRKLDAKPASDDESNSQLGFEMDVDNEAISSPSSNEPQSTDVTGFAAANDGSESKIVDQSSEGESVGEKAKPSGKKERRKAKMQEMKAARKAKKLAKRREHNEAASKAAQDDEDEKPFDYGGAESVLHAKANGKENVKSKKTFNPYNKKSGDAPKGERRLGLVKAGKTATFKK